MGNRMVLKFKFIRGVIFTLLIPLFPVIVVCMYKLYAMFHIALFGGIATFVDNPVPVTFYGGLALGITVLFYIVILSRLRPDIIN